MKNLKGNSLLGRPSQRREKILHLFIMKNSGRKWTRLVAEWDKLWAVSWYEEIFLNSWRITSFSRTTLLHEISYLVSLCRSRWFRGLRRGVCVPSPPGIAGTNSAVGHGYLSLVRVVCCEVEVSLRRTNPSSKGVLPSVVSLSVISCNNNPLHLQWVGRTGQIQTGGKLITHNSAPIQ